MNLDKHSVSRRNFLVTAAFGGLMTGVVNAAEEKKDEGANILSEKHVCRGINTCKSKGKGGDNDCAGKGWCATASAHSCHAKNDCKGQGGCGGHPGENSCKGKGACAVPLKDDKAWKMARSTFEAAMKKAGKTFGDAPAK